MSDAPGLHIVLRHGDGWVNRRMILRRCQSCAYEDTTSEVRCPNDGTTLIVVLFSALDGRRFTPTFEWEQTHRASCLFHPDHPAQHCAPCEKTGMRWKVSEIESLSWAAAGLPPSLLPGVNLPREGSEIRDDDIPF